MGYLSTRELRVKFLHDTHEFSNYFIRSICPLLTLIGIREDTFISLSFWDQILSAEFLSKL